MNLYKSLRSRLWENVSLTMKELRAKILGYKSYTITLVQRNLNPNYAIPKKVFENTLDLSIVSNEYVDPGEFIITFDKNIFTQDNKVECSLTTCNYWNIIGPSTTQKWSCYPESGSENKLVIRNVSGLNNIGVDYSAVLEIKVYN